MFVSIKKKTILVVLAIILGIAGICTVIGVVATNAYSAPKNGKLIVIDAGHGGFDGGVTGVKTGVKESDINLAIAKSLKHFLTSNGYEVVMTRSTPDGLYGMASKNRKMKDMATRKQIINEARPDLVISIHQNSYTRSAESGAQVFFAPSSEEGKQASVTMQNILCANLNTTRLARPGDYYILQCSEYLAMLIECGFLSNAEEEKKLINASYQEKVAYTIFTGVNTIFFGEGKNPQDTHK